MSPIRLLILAILFYILYRLLIAGAKKKKNRAASAAKGGELPRQDVLVEDPVCHTYIPKKQAIVYTDGNESHYFCSNTCRDNFLAEKGDEQ